MTAAPETISAIAEAIEAQRATALGHFDTAAEGMDEVRARLRFAVGNTDAIAFKVRDLSASATSGIIAFETMLALADDLRRMIFAPKAAPIASVDKETRLEALRVEIVGKLDGASHDLGALAAILRNDEAGTTEDVLRLAEAIRQNHDDMQITLGEALEVGACVGSA